MAGVVRWGDHWEVLGTWSASLFLKKWVGGERDLAYGQVKKTRGLAAPEGDGES